jgi:hypothetical protein
MPSRTVGSDASGELPIGAPHSRRRRRRFLPTASPNRCLTTPAAMAICADANWWRTRLASAVPASEPPAEPARPERGSAMNLRTDSLTSAGRPSRAARSSDVDARALKLTAARAEALFVSDVSAQAQPTRDQVTQAIRYALRRSGGVRGCAAEVAAAYGDHPETAAPRMRWARTVVESLYARTPDRPQPATRAARTRANEMSATPFPGSHDPLPMPAAGWHPPPRTGIVSGRRVRQARPRRTRTGSSWSRPQSATTHPWPGPTF